MRPTRGISKRLGAGLRITRGARPQAELAKALGVAPEYLSRWESGERRLTFERMEQIEAELGVARGAILVAGGFIEEQGNLLNLAELHPWVRDTVLTIVRRGAQLGDGGDAGQQEPEPSGDVTL